VAPSARCAESTGSCDVSWDVGERVQPQIPHPLGTLQTTRLPTFNPVLSFTTEEIVEVIRGRYGLPLNLSTNTWAAPTASAATLRCTAAGNIAVGTSPEVCTRYYGRSSTCCSTAVFLTRPSPAEHRTKEEKLGRHGFVHWNRIKAQDVVGAVKRRNRSGSLAYRVREAGWINAKHLEPVRGRWSIKGTEIRFWGLDEGKADTLIKRMINCLNCGFCVVECFRCRHFDRRARPCESTAVCNAVVACG